MKKTLLTILLALAGSLAFGQGLRDVRINEILVKNVDSYADDHAHKVGWIELFNAGYSQADLAGAHLRFVQGKDTINYRIPKTDVRTKIAPQGYLIFFADGSSDRGTFHTNFTLDQTDSVKLAQLEGIDDILYLLDQSGRTVIDSVRYDVNTQIPDVSYGRIKYEKDSLVTALLPKEELDLTFLRSVTPMQANDTREVIPKGELFRMEDPAGIAMSLIAMTVVFTALIMLYLIFRTLGKYMHGGAMRKKAVAEAAANGGVVTKITPTNKSSQADEAINGEELAAITIALYSYHEDLHDLESEVLTINRVARRYSPWNSKIYTLTQNPNRSRR
ncbi:MAG: OadG family transporter subunit [Mucinivorans sp.]